MLIARRAAACLAVGLVVLPVASARAGAPRGTTTPSGLSIALDPPPQVTGHRAVQLTGRVLGQGRPASVQVGPVTASVAVDGAFTARVLLTQPGPTVLVASAVDPLGATALSAPVTTSWVVPLVGVTVSGRGGRIRVGGVCAAFAGSACIGPVRVYVRHGRRTSTIGTGVLRISPGSTGATTIVLSPDARARLHRTGGLTVHVTVTSKDPTRSRTRVAERTEHLRG